MIMSKEEKRLRNQYIITQHIRLVHMRRRE